MIHYVYYNYLGDQIEVYSMTPEILEPHYEDLTLIYLGEL